MYERCHSGSLLAGSKEKSASPGKTSKRGFLRSTFNRSSAKGTQKGGHQLPMPDVMLMQQGVKQGTRSLSLMVLTSLGLDGKRNTCLSTMERCTKPQAGCNSRCVCFGVGRCVRGAYRLLHPGVDVGSGRLRCLALPGACEEMDGERERWKRQDASGRTENADTKSCFVLESKLGVGKGRPEEQARGRNEWHLPRMAIGPVVHDCKQLLLRRRDYGGHLLAMESCSVSEYEQLSLQSIFNLCDAVSVRFVDGGRKASTGFFLDQRVSGPGTECCLRRGTANLTYQCGCRC